jgi:DNA-binding response OmpR family regulator
VAVATQTVERRPRVLLAEDDTEMRFLVARALRKDGFEVLEFPNGVLLTEWIDDRLAERGELDISLLVTDIRMPGPSGLEVAKKLRAKAITVPMIVMTGFGDQDTAHDVRELDAVSFDKPFSLDHLRSTACLLMSQRAARSPQ